MIGFATPYWKDEVATPAYGGLAMTKTRLPRLPYGRLAMTKRKTTSLFEIVHNDVSLLTFKFPFFILNPDG
jgi:hypothetical protein